MTTGQTDRYRQTDRQGFGKMFSDFIGHYEKKIPRHEYITVSQTITLIYEANIFKGKVD